MYYLYWQHSTHVLLNIMYYVFLSPFFIIPIIDLSYSYPFLFYIILFSYYVGFC